MTCHGGVSSPCAGLWLRLVTPADWVGGDALNRGFRVSFSVAAVAFWLCTPFMPVNLLGDIGNENRTQWAAHAPASCDHSFLLSPAQQAARPSLAGLIGRLPCRPPSPSVQFTDGPLWIQGFRHACLAHLRAGPRLQQCLPQSCTCLNFQNPPKLRRCRHFLLLSRCFYVSGHSQQRIPSISTRFLVDLHDSVV